MEHFVLNARRWPRAPVRCRVVVVNYESQWRAETEDVGPGGCQLVSPRVVNAGGEIRLAIAASALVEKLAVAGRVAWTSQTIPARLGVAFTERHPNIDPRSWFVRLLQADPAMAAAIQRIPQRLSVETVLYLGEPPRFVIDFTPSELSVLRLIGGAARIADVMVRHALTPDEATRAIFSLLARRAITLARAEAVAPLRWMKALAQAETALAAEAPQMAPEPWPPPRPALHSPRPYLDPPLASADRSLVADPPRSRLDARLERAERQPPSSPTSPAACLHVREGHRRPEAEALFREAQGQFALGDISAAIALLRRALALSPRDPEISALLGQLAFRNRRVE